MKCPPEFADFNLWTARAMPAPSTQPTYARGRHNGCSDDDSEAFQQARSLEDGLAIRPNSPEPEEGTTQKPLTANNSTWNSRSSSMTRLASIESAGAAHMCSSTLAGVSARQSLFPLSRDSSVCPQPPPTSSSAFTSNTLSDHTSISAPQYLNAASHLQQDPRPGLTSHSSSTTTLMEKGATAVGGKPTSTNDLPVKKHNRVWRNLRFTFFSVYRRLHALVLIPNIITIIILAVKYDLADITPSTLATACAANLTAATLARSELVINLLFIIFGKCPQSFPLRIRRLCAKIYHLGGVHSGAAIAAVVWFALFNASIFAFDPQDISIQAGLWVLTVSLDILLLVIVILSHPGLRTRYHDAWEQTHRFGGWASIAIFWALFVLLSHVSRRLSDNPPPIGLIFAKSPSFWMLIVVTISIIIPWLSLRRVPVSAEPLSDHAIRLHFKYTDLPLCAAPRVTTHPLREWHAFAGIPEEDGNGFSCIVSRVGDFTGSTIKNPPKKLWVRGIPTRGVLHIAPIFHSMVLVATGSGIGPVLSLLHRTGLNVRVLWSTPNPEKTFGHHIIQKVYQADPNAIIINTSIAGRPDLRSIAWKLYQESGAEAVFIISNPKVTRGFVYALESRGVPTFAPIFDS